MLLPYADAKGEQGVYDGPGVPAIIAVAATSSMMLSPASELNQLISRLAADAPLGDVRTVSAGPLGGAAKCGYTPGLGEDKATMCLWADGGSVGSIWWAFGPIDGHIAEFTGLRGKIERKS
jgi:hypothetical protein